MAIEDLDTTEDFAQPNPDEIGAELTFNQIVENASLNIPAGSSTLKRQLRIWASLLSKMAEDPQVAAAIINPENLSERGIRSLYNKMMGAEVIDPDGELNPENAETGGLEFTLFANAILQNQIQLSDSALRRLPAEQQQQYIDANLITPRPEVSTVRSSLINIDEKLGEDLDKKDKKFQSDIQKYQKLVLNYQRLRDNPEALAADEGYYTHLGLTEKINPNRTWQHLSRMKKTYDKEQKRIAEILEHMNELKQKAEGEDDPVKQIQWKESKDNIIAIVQVLELSKGEYDRIIHTAANNAIKPLLPVAVGEELEQAQSDSDNFLSPLSHQRLDDEQHIHLVRRMIGGINDRLPPTARADVIKLLVEIPDSAFKHWLQEQIPSATEELETKGNRIIELAQQPEPRDIATLQVKIQEFKLLIGDTEEAQGLNGNYRAQISEYGDWLKAAGMKLPEVFYNVQQTEALLNHETEQRAQELRNAYNNLESQLENLPQADGLDQWVGGLMDPSFKEIRLTVFTKLDRVFGGGSNTSHAISYIQHLHLGVDTSDKLLLAQALLTHFAPEALKNNVSKEKQYQIAQAIIYTLTHIAFMPGVAGQISEHRYTALTGEQNNGNQSVKTISNYLGDDPFNHSGASSDFVTPQLKLFPIENSERILSADHKISTQLADLEHRLLILENPRPEFGYAVLDITTPVSLSTQEGGILFTAYNHKHSSIYSMRMYSESLELAQQIDTTGLQADDINALKANDLVRRLELMRNGNSGEGARERHLFNLKNYMRDTILSQLIEQNQNTGRAQAVNRLITAEGGFLTLRSAPDLEFLSAIQHTFHPGLLKQIAKFIPGLGDAIDLAINETLYSQIQPEKAQELLEQKVQLPQIYERLTALNKDLDVPPDNYELLSRELAIAKTEYKSIAADPRFMFLDPTDVTESGLEDDQYYLFIEQHQLKELNEKVSKLKLISAFNNDPLNEQLIQRRIQVFTEYLQYRESMLGQGDVKDPRRLKFVREELNATEKRLEEAIELQKQKFDSTLDLAKGLYNRDNRLVVIEWNTAKMDQLHQKVASFLSQHFPGQNGKQAAISYWLNLSTHLDQFEDENEKFSQLQQCLAVHFLREAKPEEVDARGIAAVLEVLLDGIMLKYDELNPYYQTLVDQATQPVAEGELPLGPVNMIPRFDLFPAEGVKTRSIFNRVLRRDDGSYQYKEKEVRQTVKLRRRLNRFDALMQKHPNNSLEEWIGINQNIPFNSPQAGLLFTQLDETSNYLEEISQEAAEGIAQAAQIRGSGSNTEYLVELQNIINIANDYKALLQVTFDREFFKDTIGNLGSEVFQLFADELNQNAGLLKDEYFLNLVIRRHSSEILAQIHPSIYFGTYKRYEFVREAVGSELDQARQQHEATRNAYSHQINSLGHSLRTLAVYDLSHDDMELTELVEGRQEMDKRMVELRILTDQPIELPILGRDYQVAAGIYAEVYPNAVLPQTWLEELQPKIDALIVDMEAAETDLERVGLEMASTIDRRMTEMRTMYLDLERLNDASDTMKQFVNMPKNLVISRNMVDDILKDIYLDRGTAEYRAIKLLEDLTTNHRDPFALEKYVTEQLIDDVLDSIVFSAGGTDFINAIRAAREATKQDRITPEEESEFVFQYKVSMFKVGLAALIDSFAVDDPTDPYHELLLRVTGEFPVEEV